MTTPLISVLLPCYDAEEHLSEALDSVLIQSHTGFEVVALDDGSRDGTRSLLEEAAARDSRIRVLVNETNLGLIRTLNRGIEACRGTFIARMDADDISRPDRLARQLRAFRRDPELGVVGSGVRLLTGEGRRGSVVGPRAHAPEACRFFTFLGTPVVHPSVMVRAHILKEHRYRLGAEVLHTEDYELFSRLARLGVRIRNLDEPLLELRRHEGSVSHTFEARQIENFRRCARAHVEAATGRSFEPGTIATLVNRLHPGVTPRNLRAGLELLAELEASHLREVGDEAAGEIRRLAREQRVDIVVQALARGRTGGRLPALSGVRAALPALLSAAGMAYLVGKTRR